MGDDDKPLSAEDVKAIVAEALAAQPKGGAAPKAGAGAGDVTAQVEAAVAKVRAGDAAKAEQQSLSDRIAALEAGKAGPPEAEKQPKKYRRITSLLWGGDDDDD